MTYTTSGSFIPTCSTCETVAVCQKDQTNKLENLYVLKEQLRMKKCLKKGIQKLMVYILLR
uniref:Uncharacterized protein n=1 Tax=Heterorhabditis bacteriophora TaxID=37862 RepID=A0A1I7WSV1_HETBA